MNTVLQHHLSAIGIFIATILLLTAPVLPNVGSHVIGVGGDPWQTLWRFESTAQELFAHWQSGNLFEYLRQELFGGGDARLVNHTVWLYLPLHVLLGQPLTYNLIWLLSFAASGYTMYLLVRHLVRQHVSEPWRGHAAAIVAGFYYMLLPYHVAHAQGHFGAMQLQWLPLLILTFFRLLNRPSLGRAATFAGVAGIQAWSEHHYILWFALFASGYVLWQRRDAMRLTTRQAAPSLVLLIALLGVLVLVPYLPTIRLSLVERSALVLGAEQTSRFSADLFAFFTPSPFHPLWGQVATVLFTQHFTGNASESIHFLGMVPLLLVVFLHQAVPRDQKRWWMGVAIAFFVLSLGPWLHLMGYVSPIPLPYRVLGELPIFSAVRAVARAGSLVGLAMAVLLGWVLATQARRRASYLLVAAAVGVEFAFAVPTPQATALSPIYNEVAAVAAPAIIELPAPTNYALSSRALYASLSHGKRVVGSIALERGETGQELQLLRTVPGLRQVLYIRSSQLRDNQPDFLNQPLTEAFLDAAAWAKAGAVLIHSDSISATQLAALRAFFEEHLRLVPVVYEDALLYHLPAGVSGDGIMIGRESGWSNVGFDRDKNVSVAAIPQEGHLLLINNRSEPVTLTLRADIPPGSHGHLAASLDHASPSLSAVEAGEELVITFTLPSGTHRATIRNQLTDVAILHNPRIEVESTPSPYAPTDF